MVYLKKDIFVIIVKELDILNNSHNFIEILYIMLNKS